MLLGKTNISSSALLGKEIGSGSILLFFATGASSKLFPAGLFLIFGFGLTPPLLFNVIKNSPNLLPDSDVNLFCCNIADALLACAQRFDCKAVKVRERNRGLKIELCHHL